MSNPKPRIRPKADSYRRQGEPPLNERLSSSAAPDWPGGDPPMRAERDPGMERTASEQVLFYEDDCLR
jgi:hypothetical protein